MNKIPDIVDEPIFLKFVQVYIDKFKKNNGFGRWLHEYKDMDKKGLFKPRIIRDLYKKILLDKFYLGFIREQAVYYIGIYAQDAAKAYIKDRNECLYQIVVITGELAYDDDDDPYTELTYDEAIQIATALNEEAEETLFKIKRM